MLNKKQLIAAINSYKRQHCPPTSGKSKADLIKIADSLGVNSSANVKVGATLTKPQLIKKIVSKNKRDPKVYKAWEKKALEDLYHELWFEKI
jgi:hypothetical protein